MNKKTQSLLVIVLLAVFCIGTLASCTVQTVNIISYNDSDLGWVAKLVQLMHKWIGNYGWTVVVFTVFLKVVMLPLDFWQRYSTRKSTLKMQKIQPLLENIDKRYGANTQRANEEKQKLYQKQGYSALSSCLPLIITMVVFFVMFGGLREYSTYLNVQTFNTLAETYYQTSLEQIEEQGYAEQQITVKSNWENGSYVAGDVAKFSDVYVAPTKLQDGELNNETADEKKSRISATSQYIRIVQDYFGDYQEKCSGAIQQAVSDSFVQMRDSSLGWLWIQNVSQPDTWKGLMPEYVEGNQMFAGTIDMSEYKNIEKTYPQICDAVNATGRYNTNGKWNGLMILPFLSVLFSFGSMWISQRLERKNRKGEVVKQDQQQATTNKTMMIIMPLMMAYFGFFQTGAFAIYMVVSYMFSIISTVALRAPIERKVERSLSQADGSDKSKASYMR